MASTATTSHRAGRRKSPTSWRGQIYAFAVTALATFVVALCLVHDKTPFYVATAIISFREYDFLTAEDSLKLTEKTLSNDPSTSSSASVGELSGAHVDVRAERTGEENDLTPQLKLTVTGTDGGTTLAQLQSEVDRALAPSIAKIEDAFRHFYLDLESAEKRAAAARQGVVEAKKRRDHFLASNRELLNAPDSAVAAQAPSPPPAPSPEELSARRQLEKLGREYEELEAARNTMLEQITPEHPKYQILMVRMDQLRSRIDEIRRILPQFQQVALPRNDPPPAAQLAAREQRKQLRAEAARLEQAVVAAMTQADQCDRAVADKREEIQDHDTPERHRAATIGNDVNRLPRPTTLPELLLSAAVAIVVGSGTLLIGSAVRTIDQAADATDALDVPVLAVLSDEGEPCAGRRRGVASLLRITVAVSELTLAATLIAVLMTARADHEFAAHLKSDPLTTLVEGVRRIPSHFRGNSL